MKKTRAALLALCLIPSLVFGAVWTPPPTVQLGDEIGETWLNTYVGANTTVLFDGLANLGGLFSELSIGTHLDNDKSLSQILLRSLGRVILDGGAGSLSNVTALTADITLGGCGGLDTGTEQNSTWYQIYLTYDPNTGTKCLVLHRAKDYFNDENYDSDDATIEIRKSTGTRTALGQGAIPGENGKIDFVDVELIRVGSVTGNIWAEIRSNNAGVPSSTVLATSDKLDASTISTTAQYLRFIFHTAPYTAVASTQYHIVLTGDWTPSDAAYIGWRCDTSSATYANGTRTQLEGGTWNSTGTTAHDFSFKLYVTRNDTAVTMPAGHTGKALLGWVFNSSGGNFYRFTAVDRAVTYTAAPVWASGVTSANNQLRMCVDCVPPTPVTANLYATTSGTTWVVPVPIGYETPGGGWRQNGGVFITTAGTLERIQVETQAIFDNDPLSHTIAMDSYSW